MNKIVEFDGIPYELARLDRAAVESLHASGVLDELGPVELIDGVLVRMSPSMSSHGYAMLRLGAALLPAFQNRYRIGTDIGVFLGETTMHAPDICVVKRDAKSGFLDVSDLVMAIEISASSLSEELDRKAREYAAHGIPEYWVVALETRKLHRHRAPGPAGYADIFVTDWEATVTPDCAPDFDLRLAAVLDDIL